MFQDDYNRFETARHAAAKRNEHQKSEESRFQAYGDRPGSGVEMSALHWQGGEVGMPESPEALFVMLTSQNLDFIKRQIAVKHSSESAAHID